MTAFDLPLGKLISFLRDKENFVLLETARVDEENYRSYLFVEPMEMIEMLDDREPLKSGNACHGEGACTEPCRSTRTTTCTKLPHFVWHQCDNLSAFQRFTEKASEGNYIAGYLRYDGSGAFGVYKMPIVFDHRTHSFEGLPCDIEKLEEYSFGDAEIAEMTLGCTKNVYKEKLEQIQEKLRSGESYQVNFTVPCTFGFTGSPFSLYERLRRIQRVSYSALIRFGDQWIISLSPELFFRREGNSITVKPMKGTAKRGKSPEDDRKLAEELHASEKECAENIMIVDLLRNDLGRISETGSVCVESLCEVEKFETVLQMTSTIRSTLKENLRWRELFEALLPSGSVTGAPKIRTMEIIRELEEYERGVSYGAIGFIGPGGRGVFSVAIRTVELLAVDNREWSTETSERRTNCHTEPGRSATILRVSPFDCTQGDTRSHLSKYPINFAGNWNGLMGVGGGITVLSDSEKEWEELQLKACFLTLNRKAFHLIETLRWENGSFFLLNEHMERMAESAEYFGFPFDGDAVVRVLLQEAEKFPPDYPMKVRLLLARDGGIELAHRRFDKGIEGTCRTECHPESVEGRSATAAPPAGSIILSGIAVDSSDVFLYHKTTNRDLYDREYKRAIAEKCIDALFMNERGELTEGAITNLFVSIEGELFTPPVECGLLNGTLRRHLLRGETVKERILYPCNLRQAEAIFVGNSVRGLLRVNVKNLT